MRPIMLLVVMLVACTGDESGPMDGAIDRSISDDLASDTISGTVDAGGHKVDTSLTTLTLGFRELGGTFEYTPSVGTEVTVYAQANLTKPLATGTTDATGAVQLEVVATIDPYVAVAKRKGLRDSWFWSDARTSSGDYGNIPVISDAAWSAFFTAAGEGETAGTATLGVHGDGDDANRLTVEVDSGGKVFYLGVDGKPAPDAEAGQQAVVLNVPAGPATITMKSPSVSGQRTLTLYPGTYASVLVSVE